MAGALNKKLDGTFEILLCSNFLTRQEHHAETMLHELVHAYDEARAHVDWNNSRHRACSEIRAANLSGDCAFVREAERFAAKKQYFNFPFIKQQQACVRRRATLSLQTGTGISLADAAQAVDQVWQVCYHDTAPFPRAPQ